MSAVTDDPLWRGLELVAPARARVSGRPPDAVTGVSIDTRTLQPGDLFVAIKGVSSDGHDHVARAFENGAAAAIVDEAHAGALAGAGPLYVVHDTLSALEGVGLAARARTKARIAAITGSVGKTSTKEMLALVLGQAGATHASVASYNNHWGVPLTLARMPRDARFGVFEIGMNHADEITPLAAMVQPHIAIVTTIAPVHVENFPDGIEGVARAKAEIFSGVAKGGLAILNRDAPHFALLQAAAAASPARFILSFGESEGGEARLESVEVYPEASYVQANVLGEALRYRIGAPGRHFAQNSLAVLLAAKAMGLRLADAAQALEHFQAPTGRGQRHALRLPEGTLTLIDESYNANPASMRAALAVLGALPADGGRRVAVLGDMLELGPEENNQHAQLAQNVENEGIDLVFAAGPRMRHLYDALAPHRRAHWAPSAAELQPALIDALRAGDMVMVKGSNGSRMVPLVKALLQHYASAPAHSP